MVIFTRWYWSPRERGGDCHHLSVPSIAYSIEWSLEGTLGSQWSQDRPRMPSFPGTVANLQNNSDSLTSSPHVEVASIFLPWAMLIAGGLSLCPSPDLTAKLTTKRACKIANTGFFIVETLIPRASVHIDDTVIKRANRELFVPGKMRGVQITSVGRGVSVAFEEFPNIPPCMSTHDHHKKKNNTVHEFKNFLFHSAFSAWRLACLLVFSFSLYTGRSPYSAICHKREKWLVFLPSLLLQFAKLHSQKK